MNRTRIGRIETAIDEELDRQAHEGARRIDVHALAARIDELLDTDGLRPSPRQQMRDAKKPSQLNASNDG
jgi:hypothetical protein